LYKVTYHDEVANGVRRDGLGRVQRKIETKGTITLATDYQYDLRGQLKNVTDGSGRGHTPTMVTGIEMERTFSTMRKID
jgi:hypothetical protein